MRDLVELAVNMVRDERIEEVRAKAELNTEERLLDLLLPPRPAAPDEDPGRVRDEMSGTRQRMREQLRDGKLDDRTVEVDVRNRFPSIELISGSSLDEVGLNLATYAWPIPGRPSAAAHGVEARERLTARKSKLTHDAVPRRGERVRADPLRRRNRKIAGREGTPGPEFSREGVHATPFRIVEARTVTPSTHGSDRSILSSPPAPSISKRRPNPRVAGRFPSRRARRLGAAFWHSDRAAQRADQQYRSPYGDQRQRVLPFTFTETLARSEFAAIVTAHQIRCPAVSHSMERLLDEVSFESRPADKPYHRRAPTASQLDIVRTKTCRLLL